MDPFFYEIVSAPDGHAGVERLENLMRQDPDFMGQATRWSGSSRPRQSDLYALLAIVSDDLAEDAVARQKIVYASGCGFPVIGVVEDLDSYEFAKAPLVEIGERNAEAFSNPERLRETLLHHAGIRLFGSGGRVFISYARRDGSDLALSVRAALKDAGIGHDIDVYDTMMSFLRWMVSYCCASTATDDRDSDVARPSSTTYPTTRVGGRDSCSGFDVRPGAGPSSSSLDNVAWPGQVHCEPEAGRTRYSVYR